MLVQNFVDKGCMFDKTFATRLRMRAIFEFAQTHSTITLIDVCLPHGFLRYNVAMKKVEATYFDERSRKKTLAWPFSAPFNVVDGSPRPWTGQGL